MSGGLPLRKVEARRVRCVILTVNPVKDGDYPRHRCGCHEASRDGRTPLLSCDPFLHQPNISLLLFDSATLRTQGGFENVMQLDLICDMVFRV